MPYFGVCFSKTHAEKLLLRLEQLVFQRMQLETDTLYNAQLAATVKPQVDIKTPKAAAQGGARPKAKAKATKATAKATAEEDSEDNGEEDAGEDDAEEEDAEEEEPEDEEPEEPEAADEEATDSEGEAKKKKPRAKKGETGQPKAAAKPKVGHLVCLSSWFVCLFDCSSQSSVCLIVVRLPPCLLLAPHSACLCAHLLACSLLFSLTPSLAFLRTRWLPIALAC